MIQTISVATALVGSAIAAIWDLKTTEVPDQVSYAMIGIALFIFGWQSIADWSYMPIVNSIIPGLAFLAFGFIMYRLGQWGGADVLLLSAIGFLLPGFPNYGQTVFSYPLTFFINLFIVGAAYMLLYAVVFAVLNKRIFSNFSKDLKASNKVILFGSVARGDYGDESDLDLLIDPTSETTLMDIGAIRFELRELLGVPVDVLTPKALPENMRMSVLSEATRV